MEKSRKVTHKNQPFFYCLLRISAKSPVRTACAVKGGAYMRATKIQMKPGCRTSNNLQEIDSIYIEGYPFYRFAKKSEVYDYLNQHPRTIQVAIAPYPYVMPALSAYGEKYVRSEANGTSRDNLLNLPRV